MERKEALKIFNSIQLSCVKCQKNYIAYSMFVVNQNSYACRQCLISQESLQRNLNHHYSEYGIKTIVNLPTPHIEEARQCLEHSKTIRKQIIEKCQKIMDKLKVFLIEVQDYCSEVQACCSSYITKITKYGQEKLPKKTQQIDQQKYLISINQHFLSLIQIGKQIQKVNIQLPELDKLKRGPNCLNQKLTNDLITAMIHVKGKQYYGTSHGQVIFQNFKMQKKVIKAHEALIRSFAFNGQWILYTGSDDFTIKAWDIKSEQFKQISVFGINSMGHSYHRNIILLNYGKIMASSRGQFDGHRIRLWNMDDYSNIECFEGHTDYIKGLVSVGDDKILSASDDRTIKLWSIRCKKCIRTINHKAKITNLIVNTDEDLGAITDEQNRLTVMQIGDFGIIGGDFVGRKILGMCGGSNLYVGLERCIVIYSWYGVKINSVEIQSDLKIHSLMEVGKRLIVLNGTGNVHKYYLPQKIG